jgi:hypothetical protein
LRIRALDYCNGIMKGQKKDMRERKKERKRSNFAIQRK